ncbi:hypothetical protein F4677DRAFT_465547 [Hypoxylon crocopeplum]|nr:hypothetical protein F4677DRAFT_465547 [Hypoxylon crocopeplum]
MSAEDWAVITEYLAILKPFKIATKRLEGRPEKGRFGAVWEILLTMEWLLQHLEEAKNENTWIAESEKAVEMLFWLRSPMTMAVLLAKACSKGSRAVEIVQNRDKLVSIGTYRMSIQPATFPTCQSTIYTNRTTEVQHSLYA